MLHDHEVAGAKHLFETGLLAEGLCTPRDIRVPIEPADKRTTCSYKGRERGPHRPLTR